MWYWGDESLLALFAPERDLPFEFVLLWLDRRSWYTPTPTPPRGRPVPGLQPSHEIGSHGPYIVTCLLCFS